MSFELQKASVLKRVSAFILDAILLCVVITGAMWAVSAITGYDGYTEKLDDYYSEYAAAYGIETFDITEEEYSNISEEERARYDEAYKALLSDDGVLHTYSMVMNLTIVITSLAIFVAYAVLEFIVPLILGNGQTVGKKIFGMGVVRCDGVKINTFMLFVRTLLGKFTIETMIPVMLVFMLIFNMIGITGLIVIGLILLLELLLLIFTKNRTVIHDAFSQAVVVDLASQMVFDTPEELIAYKTRVAAERAEREKY